MSLHLDDKIFELEQYEGEEYGEDDFPRSTRKNKEVDKTKLEKCEKFRQVLSERQELRRKNIFLQKKMIEFFKKRKMDHVLKEDPKGLDLDSKYLKRLCELQHLKTLVNESKKEMNGKVEALKNEATLLEEKVKSVENNFYEQQRNIAFGVTLKGDKRISIRVVSNFLAAQVANAEEINRLRLAEIKEKRILADKQILFNKLNSLEHGLSRADYEILKFQHEITFQIFEGREEEAKKCVERSSYVSSNLSQVQKRAQQAEKELLQQKLKNEETNMLYSEVRRRHLKLQKTRSQLQAQQNEIEKSSGLVTHTDMLHDFEAGLREIALLWQQLEDKNLRSERTSERYARFNTPEEYTAEIQREIN